MFWMINTCKSINTIKRSVFFKISFITLNLGNRF